MPRKAPEQAYVPLDHGLTPEKPFVSRHQKQKDPTVRFHDMHYALEVGVVLDGRIVREWPKWQSPLGRGGIWMCGLWEPHGYHVERAPFEVVVLLIHPEHVAHRSEDGINFFGMFSAPPRLRPRLPERHHTEALRIGRRLAELHDAGHPLLDPWRDALLHELLLLLAEEYSPSPRRGPALGLADYVRIQPALEMVFTRREFIAVEEAASACNLGRSRFDQLFKRVMADTFARFALRHRVHGAAHQLAVTDEAVKSVAFDWGFTDSSHLHAAMDRELGLTPSQYRAARRT